MRVLIADDAPQMRAWLLRALSFLGHDAQAVADAEALLRKAADFEPDIIVSDIQMPGCDGITAGLRLRKIFPGCRVVLMTGDRERARAGRQAGFVRVLDKPFDLEELAAALDGD